MTDHSTPTVSVCLLTYNHEKYIRQALKSVLSQETKFPFEIVIGDDNSTDATRQIILEYKEKYPQVIKMVLSPSNLGMNKNLINTLTHCGGRYLALLEGDDYWTSSQKIEKQVNYLEKNQECTICFHKVEVYIEATDKIRGVWPEFDPPAKTTIKDLLRNNYLHTSTVMYRNVELGWIPESFYELGIGDWPLHVMYALKGNIGFLNETMSQYRIHPTGVHSSLTMVQKYEAVLQSREFMYKTIDRKYQKILGQVILDLFSQLALMSLENKDVFKAKGYLAKEIGYLRHFIFYKGWITYLKLNFRVYFPQIYSLLSNLRRKFLAF